MSRRSPGHSSVGSRSSVSKTAALVIFAAALLAMILIMPKEPIPVASNAAGKGEGTHIGLHLTEIMTDNNSAFPDENGRFGDWVEISNLSEETMNLKNVGLSNRSDRFAFIFPDMELAPGERVLVFCDKTNKNEAGEALHAKFGLSSLGCTVFLFDANGVEIEYVTVPTLNVDESYILNEEGNWEVTSDYSPGFENTFDGYSAFLNHYTISPDTLMINEIMAAPRTGLRDEDGELSDWVEIRNMTGETVSLKNVCLSDDPKKPTKWIFPDDAIITPYGYYLVFCSGKNKIEAQTNYPHTSFSLSAEGETILLSTVTGEQLDRVTYETLPKDMSYGRDYNAPYNWQVFTVATPTVDNNSAGFAQADQYMRMLNATGVYISEVMSSADQVTAITGTNPGDFVEICNTGENVVDLSGWGLSDNINWPRKWQFPQGSAIWPGEYKVIRLDKSTSSGTDASQLRASFSLTRSGGEMMTLSDPDGTVLDRIYIPDLPTDVSYGRTWGASGFFYYSVPSPGKSNSDGFVGYAEKPSFTVPGGVYIEGITVGVNVPEGTEVRYTLDGSEPTIDNSQVYDGAFYITTPCVIRIRSFRSGLQPSETVTASYILNQYFTVRVVSLVVDPDDLWNESTGMLAEGSNAVKEPGKLPFKNTVYRQYGKIPRKGHVEVFDHDPGSTALISQGVKVALMGDYSLDMPQKSMKLRAQASDGGKYFDYPLFENSVTPRSFTYYKSFTLRNSGNDCVWTRLIDGFETTLVERYVDTDIITLAWEPCVVYINGIYWGHFNMRERKDRFCIAQHEGFDLERSDEINILRANGSSVQGSNAEWKSIVARLKNSSPAVNAEDRKFLDDNIDINSYLDWFTIEMYFGNSDPGNIMFYRLPGEENKWKCLLFDLDYGMFNSQFDSPTSYTKPKGMGQKLINNTIFMKILEVPEYFDLFCTKMGNMYRNLTVENMTNTLNELTAMLEPEMEMHFKRWAGDPTTKLVNSDSPNSAEGLLRYWNTRISRARNVINKRPYYLYKFFRDHFKLSNAEMEHYFGGPCPPVPAD